MSNEDQPTETTEPMITMRLSEYLRMDGEIKRLRATLAEVVRRHGVHDSGRSADD